MLTDPTSNDRTTAWHRARSSGLLIVGMFVAVASSWAQDLEPMPVIVTTIDDGDVAGELDSLGDALKVTTADEQVRQFDRSNVISIRPADSSVRAADPDALVLLINGDVLAGETVSAGEDTLTLHWTGTDPPTSLTLPLEFVRTIVTSQPTEKIERHRLQRLWSLNRPATDRLILLNGTYVDGEIGTMDDTDVLLSTNFGGVKTPRVDVAAVMLNAELTAESVLPTEYAVLIFRDGSRLTLERVGLDNSHEVTGQLTGGTEVRIPLDRVVCMQLFGERVVSLADKTPAEFVFTPYLIERHPLLVHRNVYGGPLRLRSTCYATGLGVHSRSDVTYELSGGDFRTFTATIGIDDMAGEQGHVVFTVLVDGVAVFDSGGVAGSDEPRNVGPIDIAGARQLTLSVDYGARGNISDVANWCNPILTK